MEELEKKLRESLKKLTSDEIKELFNKIKDYNTRCLILQEIDRRRK